jgi:hypothetical protein
MIFRFRDELRDGADVKTALVETMTHAGRSVIPPRHRPDQVSWKRTGSHLPEHRLS